MSGTQKSSLAKPIEKRKTHKNRVRIHSPGNQTREFEREFGKEDVNNLWSNGEDLRIARMSTDDKDPAKAHSLRRQQKKKRHVEYIKMKENDVFFNRKRISKDAALEARRIFGITDVDSPIHNSTRNKKRINKIVWPSDSIRSAVSAAQMRHSPVKNKSRKSEPVLQKSNSLSPTERENAKKNTRSLTLWERIFGK